MTGDCIIFPSCMNMKLLQVLINKIDTVWRLIISSKGTVGQNPKVKNMKHNSIQLFSIPVILFNIGELDADVKNVI